MKIQNIWYYGSSVRLSSNISCFISWSSIFIFLFVKIAAIVKSVIFLLTVSISECSCDYWPLGGTNTVFIPASLDIVWGLLNPATDITYWGAGLFLLLPLSLRCQTHSISVTPKFNKGVGYYHTVSTDSCFLESKP